MNLKVRIISSKRLICFAITTSVLLVNGCDRFEVNDTIISVTPDHLTVVEHDGQSRTSYRVASDVVVTLDGQPAQFTELGVGDEVDIQSTVRDGEVIATKIKALSQKAVEEPSAAAGEASTIPQIQPAEALDTSLHGLENLPADTTTLINPPPVTLDPEAGSVLNTRNLKENVRSDLVFVGQVVSLGQSEFVLKLDEGGKRQTIKVNERTRYTLDGNEATWDQLSAGQHASVQVQNETQASQVDLTTDPEASVES